MLCPNIYFSLFLRAIYVLESEHKTPNTWGLFWNQNRTHETTDKCFGIKTQHIKHLRNVLEREDNTPKAWGMFWNQNTTHQKPEKCFGIKTQHTKSLRNVLESKHNIPNNWFQNIHRTKKDRNIDVRTQHNFKFY
jgi:hypothetical protein